MNIISAAKKEDNGRQLGGIIENLGGASMCLCRVLHGHSNEIFNSASNVPRKLVESLLEMDGVDINAPFLMRGDFQCTAFQAIIDTCTGFNPKGIELLRKIICHAGADLFGMWPTSDSYSKMRRTNLHNSFYVDGTRTIHVAMIALPDDACCMMLDSIKKRDTATLDVICGQIAIKSKRISDTVHRCNALSFCAFAGKAETCRRLVLDFGSGINDMNPDGCTPLQVASYEYEKIKEGTTCSLLLNLGANPLFATDSADSAFSNCLDYLEQPFFTNNEHAMCGLRHVIDLMKQHARFRVALRIVKGGNASSASLFSRLSPEIMEYFAVRLAPEGTLLSSEAIAELYASRRPWFTSASK